MSVLRWAEVDRDRLTAVLSDALVLLPLGATEQHGPHLPTGTDALLAETVCERAAARAESGVSGSIVLAPPVRVGASDHHIGFGGTLSLAPETLLGMLADLTRSVSAAGARRLVLVNGHGGNTGVCHAAAGAASVRHELAVAHLDYWQLLANDSGAADETPVPGHAGTFETSLLLATRPDLVGEAKTRTDSPRETAAGMHSMTAWRDIDGYTDLPHLATEAAGERWLERIVDALADRLIEYARTM